MGMWVGLLLGAKDGILDGTEVGASVGNALGVKVGTIVGEVVGETVTKQVLYPQKEPWPTKKSLQQKVITCCVQYLEDMGYMMIRKWRRCYRSKSL